MPVLEHEFERAVSTEYLPILAAVSNELVSLYGRRATTLVVSMCTKIERSVSIESQREAHDRFRIELAPDVGVTILALVANRLVFVPRTTAGVPSLEQVRFALAEWVHALRRSLARDAAAVRLTG